MTKTHEQWGFKQGLVGPVILQFIGTMSVIIKKRCIILVASVQSRNTSQMVKVSSSLFKVLMISFSGNKNGWQKTTLIWIFCQPSIKKSIVKAIFNADPLISDRMHLPQNKMHLKAKAWAWQQCMLEDCYDQVSHVIVTMSPWYHQNHVPGHDIFCSSSLTLNSS